MQTEVLAEVQPVEDARLLANEFQPMILEKYVKFDTGQWYFHNTASESNFFNEDTTIAWCYDIGNSPTANAESPITAVSDNISP
jgi:hypothetical protein